MNDEPTPQETAHVYTEDELQAIRDAADKVLAIVFGDESE